MPLGSTPTTASTTAQRAVSGFAPALYPQSRKGGGDVIIRALGGGASVHNGTKTSGPSQTLSDASVACTVNSVPSPHPANPDIPVPSPGRRSGVPDPLGRPPPPRFCPHTAGGRGMEQFLAVMQPAEQYCLKNLDLIFLLPPPRLLNSKRLAWPGFPRGRSHSSPAKDRPGWTGEKGNRRSS